jgi:hypothetical protein
MRRALWFLCAVVLVGGCETEGRDYGGTGGGSSSSSGSGGQGGGGGASGPCVFGSSKFGNCTFGK